MLQELDINSKYYYHNIVSFIMLGFWIYVGIKGYKLRNSNNKHKISMGIILFCLILESIDYINRMFLDQSYTFTVQKDLPFLQFCQISFYFTLICIYISKKNNVINKKYTINQFLFDSSFLLGFSGAFQGILTPDFLNINNLLGVICIQLQHSLIILNLIWLMYAYSFRLKFKGIYLTYLVINIIITPFALIINNLLGANSIGESANYFYVNQLPKVDNFFLNFVSQYPSPEYILYIQPIFIFYFLALYFPFFIVNKFGISRS